jgi:hypothetical protein
VKELVLRLVAFLWWVVPLVVARLCASPRQESWWHPDPDRPLYSLKRDWVGFQAEVKGMGPFSWLAIAIIIVGILCMPPR